MDIVAAVQTFIRQVIERLSVLLQQAPPGALQLTGVLGLAAAVVGYYQLRGGDSGNNPQANRRPDVAEAQPGPAGNPSTSAAPPAAKPQHYISPAAQSLSPLGRIVTTKLKGKKRLTVSTPGVLVLQSDAQQLQEGAEVAPGIPELLQEIARASDVYLITQVADDIGQATVLGALEAAGVLGAGPGKVKPHKMLFCSTNEGKVSMVRQIEPDLHIDASTATINDLQRFMPQLLHVAADNTFASQPNVDHATSLHAFFGTSAA